jgi:putative transcriptional regulator
MVIVKLKEAMLSYWRRTGQKITYEELAANTGLAPGTLQSIATREGYLPTLANVEKLCLALDVPFHDMVEMLPDPPKTKRTKKKKKRG